MGPVEKMPPPPGGKKRDLDETVNKKYAGINA
jgi:hypothetical protein